MKRTLAQETTEQEGKEVLVEGWVNSRRDMGKVVFLDVRDRSGILQVVCVPAELDEDSQNILTSIRDEFVVSIVGQVKRRGEKQVNANIPTGHVELLAKSICILNTAKTPPFELSKDTSNIKEETRMKYRYLDLRTERMQLNMKLRSAFVQACREFLYKKDFIEIETPILTKSTPEGARDFVVPSRTQPGKFYALPQSPQQYKQFLMIAGYERYFQVARCFRDEDPRADRAYGEFTQLDIEMSFVTQEDILRIIEELFTEVVKSIWPEKKISQSPWPRLPHAEAVAKYGSDKPDLRKDKNDPDELAFAWTVDFPLFAEQSEEDFFHGSGQAAFAPSHHMFTAPHPDDIKFLETDPTRVRGLQHDLVLNGFEVGGGSIRIHRADIQEKIFELIGFTEHQKAQFAYMLEAFTYGTPPHGGIAPGVDRFLMAALGEPSLRELIAFPATAGGRTAVVDAPSELDEKQLKELHIKLDV